MPKIDISKHFADSGYVMMSDEFVKELISSVNELYDSLKFSKTYVGNFTNGWVGDFQYGKFGNVVIVHGRLSGGTHGQVALVLPEGFKPSIEVRQPTTGGNTLTIYASGGVVISGANTSALNYFTLVYFI